MQHAALHLKTSNRIAKKFPTLDGL